MKPWKPDLSRSDGPRYMAIADVIALDLKSGVLAVGDRLPPQRELARELDIDFTTVARGYVEARKRGLVVSHVGRGTFVIGRNTEKTPSREAGAGVDPRRKQVVDFSMNMPPEPDDPELVARMQDGLSAVSSDLVSLLRYQGFGGAAMDKEAAAVWLFRRGLSPSHDRVFLTPGAHPALLAIFGILAKPGETILSERITYPGARSIAAQLRLNLVGVEMDDEGILPSALESICKAAKPKALYLNPTLQNPLTLTMPEGRRRQICEIARKFGLPIVEDDAYGFIPKDGPLPLAASAPELTWYIGGLSKSIGAGLRLAYVVAPDTKSAWPFASAMRSGCVMASPLSSALATRWIEDGTADGILDFIRSEAAVRQSIVAQILPEGNYRGDPLSFNIWLPLTNGWTRSTFGSHMRAAGIGVVPSDAFTVEGVAPEAARICLGGPVTRSQLKAALEFMGHALEGPPEMSGSFF
ncbi:PLP-dependent aminotransferase family protein [Rhizobium sp. XQZ8]|uniref:aminotransferase-like domain-containing protein n=1 Tax=Rhizobium populisoli TaxID=2859785 RepID=UPI001C67B7DA|nr:PLP-dependent aminotransferase family protein [Rhizobium populisoli]MBW6422244.1 PLP-dependent aminotransferase family protein [Rhizobium populisoli]